MLRAALSPSFVKLRPQLQILATTLSQIPHTLLDIISLGVDAGVCHDQDTINTVHTCARSKMPQ